MDKIIIKKGLKKAKALCRTYSIEGYIARQITDYIEAHVEIMAYNPDLVYQLKTNIVYLGRFSAYSHALVYLSKKDPTLKTAVKLAMDAKINTEDFSSILLATMILEKEESVKIDKFVEVFHKFLSGSKKFLEEEKIQELK